MVWRFDDVVAGGWMDGATLYEPIAQRARWLIVTEGATDGRILRESLDAVVPDLQDFFDFVDMRENYPFTGTGNVLRFCQGLVRIHIMNQILVVLDNDTEGRNTRRAIANLDLPRNLRVTTLPDLDVCRNVRTIGPSGENREDINGRAVAIECFLDIWRNAADDPRARRSTILCSMNTIDELVRVDFFRFVAPERAADVREECRRLLEREQAHGIVDVEGLGRFGRADAEDLSEQGMADGIADLGPLLALRGIEARRLPTGDVWLSIGGGEWLIVDDELCSYDADAQRMEIEEGVVRVGAERFSLTHETRNSWWPSSRALAVVLRKLLARAGSDERAFALSAGENDQTFLLGSDAIARALGDAGLGPFERWPEIDANPELHAFRLPDDAPIGESDFRDVQRLHRDDEDIDAAIELATADGYTNRYSTTEIIVVPPAFDDETAGALGLAGLPRRAAHRHGLDYWLVDAGAREAARELVRSLHDRIHAGHRIIAQAAERRRSAG